MTRNDNKRTSSISVSPQKARYKSLSTVKNESGVHSSKPTTKKKKRKFGYKFAPINKLHVSVDPLQQKCGRLQTESIEPTLKNISTPGMSNSTKVAEFSFRSEDGKIGTKCLPTPQNNLHIVEGDRTRSYNDGPSEEVIWMFSPVKHGTHRHPKVQLGSLASTSPVPVSGSSSDLEENVVMRNESSTPITSNKFKSILTFPHISSNAVENTGIRKQNSARQGARSSTPAPSEIRKSMRDIDDIINDIVGDFGPTQIEIPSSPAKIERQVPATVQSSLFPEQLSPHQSPLSSGLSRASEQAISVDNKDGDDGDDSLIDILSQKYSKPRSCQVSGLPKGTPRKVDKDLSTNQNNNSSFDKVQEENTDPYHCTLSEIYDDDSLICDLEENKHLQYPTAVNPQASDNTDTNTANILRNDLIKDINSLSSTKLPEWIKLAKCGYKRDGFTRLVIISVKEFKIIKGPKQKILTCVDENGFQSTVLVRLPWVDLSFHVGDVIHIIEGKNVGNKRLLSNDIDPSTGLINDNLLILNPDLLVSATMIGNSIDCIRRSVLNFQLQEPAEPSVHMLIGSLVHELLQELLKIKTQNQEVNDKVIESTLDGIIEYHMLSILMCNETKETIKDTIFKFHVGNLKQFICEYVKDSNRNCQVNVVGFSETERLSISNVIDIEENIWSPMFGIKGFIDATVEAHIGHNKKLIAPLEIKTGKSKAIAHEAQGSIYTLLLTDRYDLQVEFHLMYYSRTNDLIKHPRSLHSLKHLLILRNQLAQRLKHNLNVINDKTSDIDVELPPILQSSVCDKCNIKDKCMVLNKLLENGNKNDSGLIQGEYEHLTDHLTSNIKEYSAFFKKYNRLLHLEESSINSASKELYLMTGEERERTNGRCLHGLIISAVNLTGGLYHYKFTRSHNGAGFPSIANGQVSCNDIVYISDEVGHFSLSHGTVKEITDNYILVACRRRFDMDNIHESFGINEKKIIRSVLTYDDSVSNHEKSMRKDITYRIDLNEYHFGLALARFNLLNLFMPEVNPGEEYVDEKGNAVFLKRWQGGNTKTRKLLVEGISPRFSKQPLISYKLPENQFNPDQVRAIDKVMRCKDYALVVGMPGTGKTTVIAQIIKILASNGKTVLLTSYTHSAVDNIIQKLLSCEFGILRLGQKPKIHPAVRHLAKDFSNITTNKDLRRSINTPMVVATTCLGINDPILSLRDRDFDYVILDEASQVSLPIALGPIRFADKSILVGDHHQLPPLVKNDIAKAQGLQETLFEFLCDLHPTSVVELTFQYRMNSDIMALSNELIYNGKLKCANSTVAGRKLPLSLHDSVTTSWVREVLDPFRSVVMVDYDNIPSIKEIAERDNIRNPGEVTLVSELVNGLIASNFPPSDIGIMALYRSQLRLLRNELSHHSPKLEILTADQFQGRDKHCIIISLVRTNLKVNGRTLLSELRRVNVAMSRAKSKLILVCSKRTLDTIHEIRGFIALLQANGWVYSLPPPHS
ncbi:HGR082Cp [Eremothecium sinecaudum]|uniref:DNA replication ATP-dependent helicase/nuclease DNA2 n=1 Tax=Eremothecium sinecaudum TaxID=45286 RepID=A0A0X8HVD6_9SACH|nr:HGR082Cp [Eremothecium sinecaudum]AMD22421.1 HGR082Cp [Eremothecium sinecaudum]